MVGSRIRTRSRVVLALFTAAILGTTACGGGGASAGSTAAEAESAAGGAVTTVKIGTAVPTFNTALLFLAMAANLDAKHGLDIQNVPSGAGSTTQIAAMLAGEYNFAAVGTLTAANAAAQGAPATFIAGTGSLVNNIVLRPDVAEKLKVGTDDPIEKRLKALRGLTIATSPSGGTSNSTLRYLLRSVGLTPGENVHVVGVTDSSALVAGLKQERFDATFYGIGVADVAIAKGFGILWASIPRGDIEQFDDLIGVGIMSTRPYVEAHPDVVKAFHATLAEASKLIKRNPKKAGGILKREVFTKLGGDVFRGAWAQAKNGYPAGACFTRKNWQTFLEIYDSYAEADLREQIQYDTFVADVAKCK